MAKKNSAKQQAKAEREARRAAARAAERRRNVVATIVVVAVIALGGVLVGVTVRQDRQAAADQAAELEALQASASAAAASEAEQVANRPVACDGAAPQPVEDVDVPAAPPSPADVLDDGVDYRAVIETSCGTVEIDLAEDAAPQTVSSFVALARAGFYDGLEIFRNATTIGALQTGSATNDAAYDVGYTVPDELGLAEDEGYPPGAVAMANAGPDTAGSQFFFVYDESFDAAFADNRAYTRFAEVTDGLDVLQAIGGIPTIGAQGETPSEVVVMESVRIVEADPPA